MRKGRAVSGMPPERYVPLWTGTPEMKICAICAKSHQSGAKKEKSVLLHEAASALASRNIIIRKLRRPATLVPVVRTNPRRRRYDTSVRTALAQIRELFDYPGGQVWWQAWYRCCANRFRAYADAVTGLARRKSPPNCYLSRPKPLPRYRHTPRRCVLLAQIPIKVANAEFSFIGKVVHSRV
jgi:hypothetical protein